MRKHPPVTEAAPRSRPGFRFRSPAGAAILAGLLLMLFAAGAWLKRLATRPPERLPDLGRVPAFSARDAGGRAWTNADLAGRIWIADAVTPGCGGCLVRNLRMTDLQTSMERAPVFLLTFVADPALSAPEKLRELERTFGAVAGRWIFIAGEPPFPGDRFVLVDGSGRVRASAPESDPALPSRLLDGAGDLLREVRRGDASSRAGAGSRPAARRTTSGTPLPPAGNPHPAGLAPHRAYGSP